MTSRHTISSADELYYGKANYPRYSPDGRSGYRVFPAFWKSYGVVLAIVAGGLVASATGAELPNAATKTYTTADDNVSPIDSASRPAVSSLVMADGSTQSVWTLDVPRAVKMTVTHGSSIVALSLIVTGYDEYRELMTESLAVTATGTSKTASGKKAFKYIKSYAFTSAGNATADTASLAWNDIFGLPFRADQRSHVIPFEDGVIGITGTITRADSTDPATNATGDTRGTWTPSVASDGARIFSIWEIPSDPTSKVSLFGILQA